MRSRWLVPAVALLTAAGPAAACPFCSATGETLAGEVNSADFIVYGTLGNAQRDTSDPSAFNKGTTDLTVELVIKDHEFLKGKKVVTVPKYLPADPKQPNLRHLVFFKVYDGKLDAYRGEGVPADSKLPEYLKGAMEHRGKEAAAKLGFFFPYLESPDLVISGDAYNEFSLADYKEVRAFAGGLKRDPAKAGLVLGWLKDPNTRPSRFGLYGLLLGDCGRAEDAKALRALLDDPKRSYTSGLDGVLAGYVLLDPKGGWEYLSGVVGNPKRDFAERYAGLRTVRFFWESRPDVVPKEKVLAAMGALMDQADLADLPMEDLRKWKVWELTPAVLGYAGKESHVGTPIVRRAILKFALAAAAADPKNAAAVEYVAQARQKDPKQVKYMEELLQDEVRVPPKGN
ncbi:MAG: hypothetical protein K2X82_02590 [Gemmataceae bacterium]|nr:hypothetical protein [Gemmataceae bacterium]